MWEILTPIYSQDCVHFVMGMGTHMGSNSVKIASLLKRGLFGKERMFPLQIGFDIVS